MFFVPKGNPFWLLFYSTIAGVVPCGDRKKSLHHHSAGYILFPLDHWAHPGYFENRIPLKPALGALRGGGVSSLTNNNVTYEEIPKIYRYIRRDSNKPSLRFS